MRLWLLDVRIRDWRQRETASLTLSRKSATSLKLVDKARLAFPLASVFMLS